MAKYEGLSKSFKPDWKGLVDNILRKDTPKRVYHMELFHDGEVADAIAERFGLARNLDKNAPYYRYALMGRVNRFCGWDYVCVWPEGIDFKWHNVKTETDDAALKREGGRTFRDEHTGPIQSWADFEKFPWPDVRSDAVTRPFEWCSKNIPEDMALIAFTGHICEELSWLFGYETLCYMLFDQPDLVQAVADRICDMYETLIDRVLQFPRVKMVWATDDMGFKTGTLIAPPDMRKYVLGTHKMLAAKSHATGRPYLLHSCGKLTEIIDDLIDDVKIDAKHSFEDTIEDVRQVKHTYGRRIAMIGGLDVDFMCRSTEAAIRKRVRETLDVCLPGGGYCLGTGNSVANYIPLDNYLAMVDEGMLYAR
ncbi:MAG: uroporphyrinogen decarboxylase family protein [Phycisphaerae bacterium]